MWSQQIDWAYWVRFSLVSVFFIAAAAVFHVLIVPAIAELFRTSKTRGKR